MLRPEQVDSLVEREIWEAVDVIEAKEAMNQKECPKGESAGARVAEGRRLSDPSRRAWR